MSEVTLTAETGRELGSAASRRLRSDEMIPAVVYGMGKDSVSITISRSDLRKALTTDAGVNALIRLEVDGDSDFTLVKDIQRHPVRREVTHLDLLRIDPTSSIALDVPIVVIGDAKEVTAADGIVEQVLQTLRVSVRPDSIPNEFTVDVSAMTIDDVITVGDLSLPSGCESEIDEGEPVVTAQLTRAALVEEDEELEGEEAEDGEDAAEDAGETAEASGDDDSE